MKKILLATVICLSIGGTASAQQKKTSTNDPKSDVLKIETVQTSTTSLIPTTKEAKNKQKLNRANSNAKKIELTKIAEANAAAAKANKQ